MLIRKQEQDDMNAVAEDMADEMQFLDRKPGLYLKHVEGKGRGLFCMYPIREGEELEVTPAMILNETASQHTEPTILRDYVFKIGDVSEEFLDDNDVSDADETTCVVMGIASYCNDDVNYNAEVVYQEEDGTLYYTLQATRDIPPHTEICTSYGESWFEDRDEEYVSDAAEDEDETSSTTTK